MIIEFLMTSPLEVQKSAYFKVQGRTGDYEVRIEIENGEPVFEPSSCTCIWGSFGSQTKVNIEKNKHCRHIDEVLKFLEREAWINEDKNE